jgi:hypothetical protein
LVLRPKTFYSNARDLALLEDFIAAKVRRYADLRTPTVIITGDRDTMVSPEINARVLAQDAASLAAAHRRRWLRDAFAPTRALQR